MCLCVKCRCSDLSGEGTFSPVCSFWTSTKHHFLPSFPFPMILNEFKSWNQQEASRKSHFKNIQFAFRCLLPNYWLKTINHIVSQKHDSSPSPSDLFFFTQTQPSDWYQRKHTNRVAIVLPGTSRRLTLIQFVMMTHAQCFSH